MVRPHVGAEDAPLVVEPSDWNAQDLQDRGQSVARVVTLMSGKPCSAALMQTETAALATDFLEKTSGHTGNRYARPCKLAD